MPGTYLLQCSLHAAYMSQVIHVTTKKAQKPPKAHTSQRAASSDDDILW